LLQSKNPIVIRVFSSLEGGGAQLNRVGSMRDPGWGGEKKTCSIRLPRNKKRHKKKETHCEKEGYRESRGKTKKQNLQRAEKDPAKDGGSRLAAKAKVTRSRSVEKTRS